MPASLISAMAASLLLQGAAAQAPDFSGAWTLDRARSESAAQEGASRYVVQTITQTDGDVRVVTTRDGKSVLTRYPIGPVPAAPDEITAEPRAFWQGAGLVTEGSVDIEGQTVSFRESRTLAADGSEMAVETTLKVQHGYTLRGAHTMVSGKDVYVRGR